MVDDDNAGASTTDSNGWAAVTVGPGPWLVRVYLPTQNISGKDYHFVGGFEGVTSLPFQPWLPFPVATSTPGPTLTPTPETHVFLGLTRTGQNYYFVEDQHGGYGVSGLLNCSLPMPVPTYEIDTVGARWGEPLRISAIERDCGMSITAAAFLPMLTPLASSLTLTAATSSVGIQVKSLTLNITGIVAWPTPNKVEYRTGDSGGLWLGSTVTAPTSFTTQTMQVVHPDWATRHRFQVWLNREVAGDWASYRRYLDYVSVPMQVDLALPPDPRIAPLPSAGSPSFTAQLDTTLAPSDGFAAIYQSTPSANFIWYQFFACGACQSPKAFTVPAPPPSMPLHQPAAGVSLQVNVQVFEHAIADIKPLWETNTYLNIDTESYLHLMHAVTW